MNDLMKIVLSLSFSGSILALLLFGLKLFFRDRVSKRWQYYLWLIVVLRLLLPFSPKTSLVGTMFSKVDSIAAQADLLHTGQAGALARTSDPQIQYESLLSYLLLSMKQGATIVQPMENNGGAITQLLEGDGETIGQLLENDGGTITQPMENDGRIFWSSDIVKFVWENMWYIWLMAAGLIFVRKVTIYQSFVRYVKAGETEVSDPVVLNRLAQIAERVGVKRQIELCTNHLVSSPLLIGFLNPCIVLPTADMPEEAFEYTILHELTHFKHGDMFYKWLLQLTLCLHWFNPMVYLMHRDIDRLCEFACDESVVKYLDKNKRRKYGDTLINSLGTGGIYRSSLASVTLSENGKLLKERVERIMDYKKMSKKSTAVMILVTSVLVIGAVMIGAYMYTERDADGTNTENLEAYKEGNQISLDMQEPLQEFPQTVYVDEHVCKLRDGAGEEYDVIGLVSEGEKLIILEAEEGEDDQTWYKVDQDSLTDGKVVTTVEECYIRSDLVLKIKE